MLTKRIIPCLDVRDGRVVKGVQFQGLRDAGDPAELAARYQAQGADELAMLDVAATPQGRGAATSTVARIRRELSIPLVVGGGVRELDDVARLLDAGADKVAMNTAATSRPGLIADAAERFGSQCVVIAIDASTVPHEDSSGAGGPRWQVRVRSGEVKTTLDALEWARRAASLGAGEILLTSHDRDGTRAGYDLALTRAVAEAVTIPVIASGGAASPDHLLEALTAGADAVLAASIFHDGTFTVADLKRALALREVEIRP